VKPTVLRPKFAEKFALNNIELPAGISRQLRKRVVVDYVSPKLDEIDFVANLDSFQDGWRSFQDVTGRFR